MYGDVKILGIDYAMHGMAVFSEETGAVNIGYYRKSEKKLGTKKTVPLCERQPELSPPEAPCCIVP